MAIDFLFKGTRVTGGIPMLHHFFVEVLVSTLESLQAWSAKTLPAAGMPTIAPSTFGGRTSMCLRWKGTGPTRDVAVC